MTGPRQRDIYQSRIMPLIAHRTALLVIDVQNWVMDEDKRQKRPEFYEDARRTVIPNLQRLVAAARSHRVEVVYTVIENYTEDGRDRSLDYKLSNFFIAKGSRDAKVIDELAPGRDEMVVRKTSSSLFNSTNFDYLARNIGIDTIAVTGFLTDQCVDHTIRDGADRGFHMICVSDACATDTRVRHAAALNAFKGYCRTETTESLIAAINRDFVAAQ
ncbi:cysteine hydrolase family protein [Allomesorhizobium camelthorni]|uniref:Cysteine hydrolase n=1 Tax=Allomesorhizobium camelthorni TaxID=475069 RepID=A0A6G4WLM2_9HYPH|nr:isochorismatase family cysteine hydrolase [Mesorhizobium camelthorni]NGO55524.1 cysteine hydrolase [Mesorhizobium camelthorni]